MNPLPQASEDESLLGQLGWFVRLRWLAGVAVVAGAVLAWTWFPVAAPAAPRLAIVGAVILAYNLLLWRLLRGAARMPKRRKRVMTLIWVQLLLDLACLTALVVWTGGLRSPLAGFYVFHMVFASLLLSQRKAFAIASGALLIMMLGLWLAGQWPADEPRERWILIGLCVTLLLTVYLANHITEGLRRQNRQIRAMTAELRRTQQAMIQHEKMVALGQMAAGVAHEVANPLASMDSLLQLMLRKPERVNEESLATLRSQIERINQIVRQMKTFAHPAVESECRVQPLNATVDQAIEIVQMDPRWRRVQLERRFAPDAGQLALAPQALQQVLVNLIINSLDATAEVPQPRIVIQTARREDEWCVVEVTDNGHGIPQQHLDRLFEPFFTTKPVGQGTGLGLSISYSLVQRHGGSISVRSQVGQGTTFTVRLPVKPPASAASCPREGPANGIPTSEKPSH